MHPWSGSGMFMTPSHVIAVTGRRAGLHPCSGCMVTLLRCIYFAGVAEHAAPYVMDKAQ